MTINSKTRLINLRKEVGYIDKFFGQVQFQKSSETILNNDKGSVENFIETLENDLNEYIEYTKDYNEWSQSDRDGRNSIISRTMQIIDVARRI